MAIRNNGSSADTFTDDTPLILRVHHTSKAVVSSRQDTISYALHNPALLAALLCATSSAMYVETEKTEHLLSSIHFKGQMISHLKGQINESSGAEALMPTLYAISILLWAEVSHPSDLHAAANAHISL